MSARTWTVKTLTIELQRQFDRFWPRVTVEGEVGQLQIPRSGHCYFQLREGNATLGGVMWRTDWQSARFQPKVGDRVRCRGKVSLYNGRVQLYAKHIQPAGEGALAAEIRARTERLRKDGLLDPARKRPLPAMPRTIGIATSANGAAIADFLRVSRQRFPAARILLAACTVQGPEAPASVLRALSLLIEHGGSEVIVVTRGGGSKDDLLAFMDETLARAIAASPIPVVSAVGHEIDTSLTDLVADAVAPTPSAAANIVLPDRREAARRVADTMRRLDRAWTRQLDQRRQRVDGLARRLRHPAERIQLGRRALTALDERLANAWRTVHRRRVERLAALRDRLEALSPLAVLQRGYAMARTDQGRLLTDAANTSVGQVLSVHLARGSVRVRVEEVYDGAGGDHG
jgi:exodeoxyribonuclease VII large subunit